MFKYFSRILLPILVVNLIFSQSFGQNKTINPISGHTYDGVYSGKNIERIAFPIGGIGAGMFCIEGTGAISHMSVRNNPDMFNEPTMFAAIKIMGSKYGAKVLEGPVPDWKKYGMRNATRGTPGADWGLSRFTDVVFFDRFPFCEVALKDKELPIKVTITGWSPFIPTDEDNSSLPVGATEYKIKNISGIDEEYIFTYSSRNFMTVSQSYFSDDSAIGNNKIQEIKNGFILSQSGSNKSPEFKGDFAIFSDDPGTIVSYSWFRGGWNDPLTMTWNHINKGIIDNVPPIEKGASGATLSIPFKLKKGEEKIIRILMAWYVPNTKLRTYGAMFQMPNEEEEKRADSATKYHRPWYSHRFKDIQDVASYWTLNYDTLRKNSQLFSNAFYKSTLPPEVTEAVAANLTILKSTTVLRQYDGRLWGWEGSHDNNGSCEGSCTHVWNYAQATCHLFPKLEMGLRNTEFGESQNDEGHQSFRTGLPIRPVSHEYYSAADGQLGGIMKVFREWRISGDSTWLKEMYPKVKNSLDYCIRTWDPKHKGAIEEPHHNTYDIEFWGAEPMCSSIYLGALEAIIEIGKFLREDVQTYKDLLIKGGNYMNNILYNGEYYQQKIQINGLVAKDPIEDAKKNPTLGNYTPEALALLKEEGPKYQYGSGCLSDGVIGGWMAKVCGLPDVLDSSKVKNHLLSVYKYNFKADLSNHSNPQRSTYALGKEAGLFLCTWPKGGELSLPFVYSNEVWTGIEYQVAAHLIFSNKVKQGLDIVKACRDRYNGAVRNPFDEYECGHWYARAMSSYSLIEALTGVRYDAVDEILYIDSKVGNFTSFLSTATGFGNVIYKNGNAILDVTYGKIPIKTIKIKD